MFPTIVMDDFFTNPEKIKDFISRLEFTRDSDGKWPGERTLPLHLINYDFFEYVNKKVLSILYPNNFMDLAFTAQSYFQKISSKRHPNPGWIHKDTTEATAIVYLSKHKNCGTTLWTNKNFYNSEKTAQIKRDFNKKEKHQKDEVEAIKLHNNNFEKNLEINSIYNRIIIFDSKQHHSASNFLEDGVKEDRLTFITFIETIVLKNLALKYPVTECRRLDK